ncbi:MAG: hypothetical protein M1834_005948 [Cirrosporium novae-zelandiae]|nr:MAG: hypothetical protein M1834_005948 [Cirrosporium novae-zelandiae]
MSETLSEKPFMDYRNERTPLIQRVRVAPPRERYPHSTLRRFCTIVLGCCLFVVVTTFLVVVVFDPHPVGRHHHHREYYGPRHLDFMPWSSPYPHKQWPSSEGISYTELQEILLSTPDEDMAREWSSYYTAGPHLAGKNLSQAIWTKERWQEFGIADTSIVAYDTYINYPLGHRLALLEKTSDKTEEVESHNHIETQKKEPGYKIKYECSLEEDVLEEDPTSSLADRIPTFHGYSASGNVTAQYVYVNFGTYQDFEDLVKANVSLKGKIALAKYGGIFRGLKVKRAQDLGMIGAVLYSDPQEDGEITELNGYAPYPDGPARNPSAVQRGSVENLSMGPGDPTTPGYPSKPGVPRQSGNHSIPHIPSVPISYRDALPLLLALNGHGPNASSFNKYWQGGGLVHKGVQYNIGPSPPNLVLNLVNEQEYVTTPLWNVIGIVNGSIPDEVIVLGNHRDAWIAGGAGDPNSGSAAFNEVIRAFGAAIKLGWKPARTIVFASWDGEEYGLIGSTEWVEEYIPWLSKAAVAYLNVDVGCAGSQFKGSASPLLNKALNAATSLVSSPNQTIPGQTVYDVWNKKITTLGSGSDYTAFLDFAGIPSVDFGFSGNVHINEHDAVYMYHSNYDSFYWMDKYADPGWHYHATIAKIWGLLAANLIETPIIAFNTTDYAIGIQQYLSRAEEKAKTNGISESSFSFSPLEKAAHKLHKTTLHFSAYTAQLADAINEGTPWWRWWERVKLFYQVRKANRQLKEFERVFLYQDGLDGRTWFKHTVFAPGLWTGYAGATFPGLVESFETGNLTNAKRWAKIIEGNIVHATNLLG